MLFLLSPAKSLDETTPAPVHQYTEPMLLSYSAKLIKQLQQLSPQKIASLMHLSDKLALLNFKRYATFQTPFTLENAKQALFLFKGDVYEGMNAYHLSEQEITYIQNSTAILSGLYGLVRPLDLIQPYRLEMGTKFATSKGKDLYSFWGNIITNEVNKLADELNSQYIINLASNEYFKAVAPQKLKLPVITPVFKDRKGEQYKIISFYAKRARGSMVRFAAQNNITDVHDLKSFDLEGYQFDAKNSTSDQWLFLRTHR